MIMIHGIHGLVVGPRLRLRAAVGSIGGAAKAVEVGAFLKQHGDLEKRESDSEETEIHEIHDLNNHSEQKSQNRKESS